MSIDSSVRRPVVNGATAQPHHLLDAVDHLEVTLGGDIGNDHVDRIRTDVDRGQPHTVKRNRRDTTCHYSADNQFLNRPVMVELHYR